MSMTPTPDPPPAAPLTPEQIAALLDKIDMQLDAGYPLGVEEVQPLYSAMEQLLGRNAALRDRLARAEEREAAARGVIEQMAERMKGLLHEAVITREYPHTTLKMHDPTFVAFQAWAHMPYDEALAALSERQERYATPTDGAARAGAATASEGDTR